MCWHSLHLLNHGNKVLVSCKLLPIEKCSMKCIICFYLDKQLISIQTQNVGVSQCHIDFQNLRIFFYNKLTNYFILPCFLPICTRDILNIHEAMTPKYLFPLISNFNICVSKANPCLSNKH